MTIYKDVTLVAGWSLLLCTFCYADDSDTLWLDQTHQEVSSIVGSWSNGLDAYLSGRQPAETNLSYISVRFGPIIGEESTTGFFDFNTRIRLPNTQNRLNFVIESDAKQLTEETQIGPRGSDESIAESARNIELAAAIRYVEQALNATVDAGVLLALPLDPYLKIQFTQSGDLGQWRWQQSEQVFSYYSLGKGGRYGFGLQRPLNDRFEFGVDLGISHLEQEGTTAWRENAFVNHAFDEDNKLRYQFSVLQEGWPRASQEAFLYFVQWQHRLYGKWLIGQVQPQITHQRSDDYAASASLTLSLELLFGEDYL
ncbi:hypothetical protein FJM67_06040 [Maribrevibacterium harenarium]|uniref:Uncharacterized protein n=1 Tax=Maribrevibacterium harenarium TaxID=2589817 RepID=A0A501WW33_9GAMM|nr:hypothetical protein [Maribrevibacterium harenarium]TPE53963.1 hypothetical protein FJM67_06040 [Maribrevibacterium harenarium]